MAYTYALTNNSPAVVGMSAPSLSDSTTWLIDDGAGPIVPAASDACVKNVLTIP